MISAGYRSLAFLPIQLLSDLQQLSFESFGLSEWHSPFLLANISNVVRFSREAEKLEC